MNANIDFFMIIDSWLTCGHPTLAEASGLGKETFADKFLGFQDGGCTVGGYPPITQLLPNLPLNRTGTQDYECGRNKDVGFRISEKILIYCSMECRKPKWQRI